MATNPRFVTVTNKSRTTITLYPDLPGTKKEEQRVEIKLAPNERSRPLPYDLLIETEGWQNLVSEGCILVEDIPPWRSTLVNIKNLTSQPLRFEVRLPRAGKPKASGKSGAALRKKYTIRPQKFSPRLHVDSILKLDVEELARQRAIELKPVPYIGPPLVKPPCVGSFGNDDVYLCYECGQPIVIRYYPPRPIHI
ncbi:MAG TPA: hypothetical protein VH394_19400 [Thermoanaerobaculia bacterium]|jgi:hypothetical protein|nr:hypothetical protein [Thermoanaerobaculia bacterium]